MVVRVTAARPDGRAHDDTQVLLIGVDSAPGRTETLTDSMLLVSILPSTGEVEMVSTPRDISRFPLYDGGIYTSSPNIFVLPNASVVTTLKRGAP